MENDSDFSIHQGELVLEGQGDAHGFSYALKTFPQTSEVAGLGVLYGNQKVL